MLSATLVAAACGREAVPTAPSDQPPVEISAPISGVAGDLQSSAQAKVSICHRTEGTRGFVPISVAEAALPAHLAHGDGRVGDLVPGQPGMKFGTDCKPTPAILAAPRQLGPANGAVFSHYPRTTTMSWAPVAGATGYVVEVEYCWPFGCPADPGTVWAPFGFRPASGTTYTFDFVGRQAGRWRVWALDSAGTPGEKSGWWLFYYLV